MRITIKKVDNGHLVDVEDGLIRPKEYVFKSTDVLRMLEFVRETVCDRKVTVSER